MIVAVAVNVVTENAYVVTAAASDRDLGLNLLCLHLDHSLMLFVPLLCELQRPII